MAYGLSNGYVTDDVTWPQRCCEAVRSSVGYPIDILAWFDPLLTKICAKTFYIFVPSDLDLSPLDLKFALLVIFVQGHSPLNQKFLLWLSCFEKMRGTCGRTDRDGTALNAPPPYREGHIKRQSWCKFNEHRVGIVRRVGG